MAKKDKEVTSKGGNSFLTIKKAHEEEVVKSSVEKNNVDNKSSEKASSTKKPTPKKPQKSEEEKIEEFTDKVTKILDKVETLKTLFKTLFQKKSTSTIENIKMGVAKGKLKFLKPFLPMIIVIQKIQERFFSEEEVVEEPEVKEEVKEPQEPRKPITFLELAEKNIIFTDNKKNALYTLEQLRGKHGYVASDSVINPMVMENIINAFREVAPKAKAIPTPELGRYAGIPMTEVMENMSEDDVMMFLEYVRNFPRGYVGKNYRITESFAGWAVSGTPDD